MVTVEDLLSTPELDLRLLSGNGREQLRWVATSELEDPSPYLEGGELLLTTGLRPCGDWPGWLTRLAGAGVSAVGFGTGLSHDAVPAELVGAAPGCGVAVLEVPAPTSFTAVSRRVADLLRHGENQAEAAAARAQRDLAADAVGDDGLRRVLHRLAHAVRGEVWLLDPRGAVLHAVPRDAPPPAETASALARVQTRGLRAALTDVSPERSLLLRAVGTTRPRWLLVRAAHDLPRAAQGTVGTAAALLGLLSQRAAERPEEELRACVLDLLCTGEVGAARRVLAVVGGSAALEGRVRLLRAEGGDEELPDVPGVLLARTERAGGRVLALCPDGAAAGRAQAALTAAGHRVGVGRAVDVADAAAGDASALAALARTTPERPLVRAEDVRAGGLAAVEGVADYLAELLAPLDDLPPAEADRLLRTAQVFLLHHGQRRPTADALGVHRNTVRQRIARLEAVLGRSLARASDRAELVVALSAREPLGTTP